MTNRKKSFKSLKNAEHGFLGIFKAEDFKEVNNELKYLNECFNMSLKMPFLESHLDVYPSNCGELRMNIERVYQKGIFKTKKRYKGE